MKSTVLAIIALLAMSVSQVHATTIAVTNTNDSGPGSLRSAITSASNSDMIDASGVTGTVTLVTGELLITNPVTILGPGPSFLVVDGNRAGRSFHITQSNTVTLSSLTISNGAFGAFDDSGGGGIYVDHATLTVSNCVITMNSADIGGGIFNDHGTLTVLSSTICSNSATGFAGGGIDNEGSGGQAMLTVIASTIRNNSAAEDGGGIYNDGWDGGTANVAVAASTISGNFGGLFGGGFRNDAEFNGGATLTLSASTVSSNSANIGGGLYNESQLGAIVTMKVLASTFRDNLNDSIHNESADLTNAILEIGDTVLESATGQNISSGAGLVISRGYNLSSDSVSGDSTTGPGGYLNGTGDIRNTDPSLGPLQDNGGPTFTHGLLPCSPAVDQGNQNAIPALARDTDQRGFPRLVDDPTIANSAGGDGSDIGAYELQAGVSCPSIVLSPSSLPDGAPGVRYEQEILANGTVAQPLCFTLISGALPAGLRFSSDGVISGFPCAGDISQFTVRAADTNNCTATLACSLTIRPVSENCADLTGAWSNVVERCGARCKIKGTLIIQNIGGTNAPTSFVRYYLSSSEQLGGGATLLGQHATGTVRPSKPKKHTLSVNLPRGTSASGQFIIAVVDADNTVPECNECNNFIIVGPFR